VTEIYIVKHIDNSRLKKEVDYRRTKECFVLLSLGVFGLLIFLLLAWQHFEILRRGYEHESLKTEINRLDEENHKLKLERAFLRSLQRIDLIARRDLGLVVPQSSQIVILPTSFPTDLPVTQLASTDKARAHAGMARLQAIR